jgi:hypothetical protein
VEDATYFVLEPLESCEVVILGPGVLVGYELAFCHLFVISDFLSFWT